ncbi:YbjN domain-containing protein [Exiguobacterium flavidum]|uniref:YbjN domain-containing protein n=1 Tax=Exiguobacterium flavidum TaxID=2184695 RepID=UPI001300B3EC|nr:YbjN domain-containing protein [Exiguobacterium flavidum]
MSNVSTFRNYLQQQNMYMEEIQEDNGGCFFRTRQDFDNGGSVVLVVSFNENEDLIDLQAFGIANINNPLKKETVHHLINELNVTYRFTKFIEVEGSVSAQYSYSVEQGELDPAFLMDSLLMLFNSAKDAYPKFMKLQWA